MRPRNLWAVYFSATGPTRKTVESVVLIDLRDNSQTELKAQK